MGHHAPSSVLGYQHIGALPRCFLDDLEELGAMKEVATSEMGHVATLGDDSYSDPCHIAKTVPALWPQNLLSQPRCPCLLQMYEKFSANADKYDFFCIFACSLNINDYGF